MDNTEYGYQEYHDSFDVDLNKVLRRISSDISDLLRTPEQAREVIRRLSEINWDEKFPDERTPLPIRDWLIENLKLELAENARNEFYYWFERGRICYDCKQFDRSKQLTVWHVSVDKIIHLCESCWQQRYERTSATCLSCGTIYLPDPHRLHGRKSSNHLCSDCYKPSRVAEVTRIAHHLKRAREAGTGATLTLPQWTQTLEHFQFHCAYCGGDYECLEHFIPISDGGGTVSSNCVPSCKSCNSIKSNWWPGSFAPEPFSTGRIQWIQGYLAGLQASS